MDQPDDSTPKDPLNALVAAAVMYHEAYISFQEAGFTQDEAMKLLIGIVQAGIANGTS